RRRITFSFGRRAWAALVGFHALALALTGCRNTTAPQPPWHPSVVIQWDSAELEAVRHSHLGPPMVARALAVAHTAMYDAWAAYDAKAVGTRLGATLRRPATERTIGNKERAVSYAAYRALADLFPSERAAFDGLMQQLGYDPSGTSTDATTAEGVGNVAAEAVLTFRHHDGSNQLGDLASGSYSDYTSYQPINSP